VAVAWSVVDASGHHRVVAATARWAGGAFGLAAGPAVVGAGSSPALSFAASTELPLGGGALLLLNADGFCQNNEAQNKAAAAPGLCGLTSNPGTKVRKTPSWPRGWANFSPF
jgi:hypothetical protein